MTRTREQWIHATLLTVAVLALAFGITVIITQPWAQHPTTAPVPSPLEYGSGSACGRTGLPPCARCDPRATSPRDDVADRGHRC